MINTILSVAHKQNVRQIKKIVLKFGIFALIQEEQFRFCFEIVKVESEITAKSQLEIIWTPGELECTNCHFQGEVKDHPQDHKELAPLFKCPRCKSYSTNIVSGTETFIDSIMV